jgi:hypothetical protein
MFIIGRADRVVPMFIIGRPDHKPTIKVGTTEID